MTVRQIWNLLHYLEVQLRLMQEDVNVMIILAAARKAYDPSKRK